MSQGGTPSGTGPLDPQSFAGTTPVRTVTRLNQIAPGERFDYWWTLVAESIVPVFADSSDRSHFWAEMVSVGVGNLQLSRVRCTSFEAHRTELLVRRSAPEVYQLSVTLQGRSEF